MMDKNAPLPDGWITRQSKSYPDKVYYFNTNTGESSWDVPDFILSGHVTIKSPTTPQSIGDTYGLKDASAGSKRKVYTSNNLKSPIEKPHVPTENRSSNRLEQPVQKKSKISPIKFPRDEYSDRGIVNMPRTEVQVKRKENVTRNLKGDLYNESRSESNRAKLNTNQNALGHMSDVNNLTASSRVKGYTSDFVDLTSPQRREKGHKSNYVDLTSPQRKEKGRKSDFVDLTPDSPGRIILSPSSKYRDRSTDKLQVKHPSNVEPYQKKVTHTKEVDTVPYKSKQQPVKSVSKSPLQDYVEETSEVKSSITNKWAARALNSIKPRPSIMSKPLSDTSDTVVVIASDLPKSNKNRNASSKSNENLSETTGKKDVTGNGKSSRVSKIGAVKDNSEDKRKIVKSLQKQNSKTDRTVKAGADKGLTVNTTAKGNESLSPDEILAERALFRDGNDSTDSLVDSDNEGKLKMFIGNKEKLLSIQSWIDNLQQGSDSPRKEFYGLNTSVTESSSAKNESADSGFLSPCIKPERGWPGMLKSSSVSSRDLVAMEVETWQLPEVDTRVEENMEVDIDEIILEARELIKSGTVVGETSKEGWEPVHHEEPVFQSVVIVIDTNVFLSNLSQVDALKDHHIPNIGKPLLFIPWVVLRELDVIKEQFGGKNGGVQNKARKAIWLLRSFLSKKLPNVRGQTPRQDDEAAREFKASCNDDSILQACLQCQKLYDHCEVILFTNDNNLIVKCMVTGVKAYSSIEIMDALNKLKSKVKHPTDRRSLNVLPSQTSNASNVQSHIPSVCSDQYGANPYTFNGQNRQNVNPYCDNIQVTALVSEPLPQYTTSLSSDTHRRSMGGDTSRQSARNCDNHGVPNVGDPSQIPLPHPTQNKCMADSLLREEHSFTIEALMEEVYIKLIAVLKEGFGKVLEEEMKLAYDDIWLQIVMKKPPWSFLDILECWKKHWRGVFGMVFRRSMISNVENLCWFFQSNRPRSVKFLFDICTDALIVLRECVRRNRYGETMFGIKECVLCMYELCEGLNNNTISIQSISSLNDYLKNKLVPDKSSEICNPHPAPPLHSNDQRPPSVSENVSSTTAYENPYLASGNEQNRQPQISVNNRFPLVSQNNVPSLVCENSRLPLGTGNHVSFPVPRHERPPFIPRHNVPFPVPRNERPPMIPGQNVPFPVPSNERPPMVPGNNVPFPVPMNNRPPMVLGNNAPFQGPGGDRPPLVSGNNTQFQPPGNIRPPFIPGNNIPFPAPPNERPQFVPRNNAPMPVPGNIRPPFVPFPGNNIPPSSCELNRQPLVPENCRPTMIPGNHMPPQDPAMNRQHRVPGNDGPNWNGPVQPGHFPPHHEQTNNNRINLNGPINEQTNNNRIPPGPYQEQPNLVHLNRSNSEQTNDNRIHPIPHQEQNNHQVHLDGSNINHQNNFAPFHQQTNHNHQLYSNGPIREHNNNHQINSVPMQEQTNQNNQTYLNGPIREQNNNQPHINGPISDTPIVNPPVNTQIEQPSGDKVAGEFLQHLWQFMSTTCNRISQAIEDRSTGDVEQVLHQIVPAAKDLRIIYVCLLEVPIPELSMHENDFTQLADVCNSFLGRCGEQVKSTVTPVQFLMLMSNHSHRATLLHFQTKLDDMLRHLYECLQIVFPDD